MEAKLEAIDQRLEAIERRMDRMEADVNLAINYMRDIKALVTAKARLDVMDVALLKRDTTPAPPMPGDEP